MSQATLESRVESLEKTILAIQNSIKSKQPTQPEYYQGFNKWYLIKSGAMIRATEETASHEQVKGYGIDKFGKWDKDFTILIHAVVRELTEREATQTILKGCEQNGIVEGARVKILNRNRVFEITDINSIQYYSSNDLWCNGACIFDKGKFAEVVKDEKPTDKN